MRLPLAAPATALLLYLTSARAGSAEQDIQLLQARDNSLLALGDGSGLGPSPVFAVLTAPAASLTYSPSAVIAPAITPVAPSHNLLARQSAPCTGGAASVANGPAATPPSLAPAPGGNANAAPAPAVPAPAVGNIPTAISGAPVPTGSLAPQQYADNLANAKILNAIYANQVNDSSVCSGGQVACYKGQLGLCTGLGLYNFTACAAGKSCFAMPMNVVPGVSVGCVDVAVASKVLGIVIAPGASGPAVNGPIASSSSGKSSLANVIATTTNGIVMATVPAAGGVFSFTTVWSNPMVSHMPLQSVLAIIPIH